MYITMHWEIEDWEVFIRVRISLLFIRFFGTKIVGWGQRKQLYFGGLVSVRADFGVGTWIKAPQTMYIYCLSHYVYSMDSISYVNWIRFILSLWLKFNYSWMGGSYKSMVAWLELSVVTITGKVWRHKIQKIIGDNLKYRGGGVAHG